MHNVLIFHKIVKKLYILIIHCKCFTQGRSWLSKAEDERHRRLQLQPNRDLFSRGSVQR